MQLPLLSKTITRNQSEQLALRQQVSRLIRNKMSPLSLRQYIIKPSTRKSISQKTPQTLNSSLTQIPPQFPQSPQKQVLTTQRSPTHREEIKNPKKNIKKLKRRRAMAQFNNFSFQEDCIKELQAKVQRHIVMRRIDLIQGEYTLAEECSRKVREQICNRLARSPLEKYLQIFQKNQEPTDKIHRVQQITCEQILKQIRSIKTLKQIQCVQNLKSSRKLLENSDSYQIPSKISGKIVTEQSCPITERDINQSTSPSPTENTQIRARNLTTNDKINSTKKKKKTQGIVKFNDKNKTKKNQNKIINMEILDDIKKEFKNQSAMSVKLGMSQRKICK